MAQIIEARLEVQRDCLTRVLRMKLSGDTLARAIARVEQQDDDAIRAHWFKQALTQSPETLVAELRIAQTHLEIRREVLLEVWRTKLSGDALARATA